MAKAKRTATPVDDDLDWRDDDDVRREASALTGFAADEVRHVADTPTGPVIELTNGRRYVHAVQPDAEGKTGLLLVNPPAPAAQTDADRAQAAPPAVMVVDGRTVFRSSGFPVYVGGEGVDIDDDPAATAEEAGEGPGFAPGASDNLAEHITEPATNPASRERRK